MTDREKKKDGKKSGGLDSIFKEPGAVALYAKNEDYTIERLNAIQVEKDSIEEKLEELGKYDATSDAILREENKLRAQYKALEREERKLIERPYSLAEQVSNTLKITK